MTKSTPLVLVLGAGASHEVDLPVGAKLTELIADSIRFKIDGTRQLAGGDRRIRDCLYQLAQSRTAALGTIQDYVDAARVICEGMPLAPSIDNFIDCHRQNERIAQVAKLAIAACILKAEKSSSLYVSRDNIYNKIDFLRSRNTWFNALFSLISQHCPRDKLEERFSRLTIVSFNYDRCVKHFLREAIITYYSLDPRVADELVRGVRIYHPYGSVGSMQFEADGHSLDFGADATSTDLIKSADRIKTFTEGTDHATSEIDAIRSCIAGCKTLVFLGFAFHPLNLKLLYGDAARPPDRDMGEVFSTAFGISDSNTELIVDELVAFGGYTKNKLHLRQDLTATKLINEYSRHLSRIVHGEVG